MESDMAAPREVPQRYQIARPFYSEGIVPHPSTGYEHAMAKLTQLGTAGRRKDAFLPVTLAEARERGWDQLDVVLVNGDAYVDHPTFGVPLIGRLLASRGFKVGILSQPRWDEASYAEDFAAFGKPRLFFGVS